MSKFRYLRDPIFRFCVVGYGVMLLVRLCVGVGQFVNSYANDLICVGVWLPVALTLARTLRVRRHDGQPTGMEVLAAVAVWSVMFEIWLPYAAWNPSRHTADPMDIVAYAVGAAIASLGWNWIYGLDRASPKKSPEIARKSEAPLMVKLGYEGGSPDKKRSHA